MKTNKEIIIRDLGNLFIKYKHWQYNFMHADISEREFNNKVEEIKSDFAFTLLSKLQILDRKKAKEILEKTLTIEGMGASAWNSIYGIEEAVTQICQLIPEEGVVIAEGGVKNIVIGGFITYKIGGQYIDDLLKQFIGKKGKLIFIEEK